MKGYFIFNQSVFAKCDANMMNSTTQKLWQSFCLNSSKIELTSGEANAFIIGNASKPDLPKNKEYAISVTEDGICIVGKDYGSLMRGYFVLLMRITIENNNSLEKAFKIPVFNYVSDYKLENRMIHICIFPENDYYYIKKLIRLSAICQYTHIIIEFWGMLKYDCLKELAWENAFTKEQAKNLIREAKQLGIKPIPMFNMFGHATASRLNIGKHVVLDQNPSLQYLFTPDGWAWDITSKDAYQLLGEIRKELYEIFEDSEYFHIGCDEAYYYTINSEKRAYLPEYLKRLTNDIVNEGYRPMLWMDMILERSKFPKEYYAFGKDEEANLLLNSLAEDSVMVDWQYNIKEAPIKSSTYLKEKAPNKDLIIAPWYDPDNLTACINTVVQNNMFGIMFTTWHTLNEKMPSILKCALQCGAKTFDWSVLDNHILKTETATLLRRVSFEGNSYTDSGWSKYQINI